jgi:hypothetical protein
MRNYTIKGKCENCKVIYAWHIYTTPLSEAYCPKCRTKLRRTTHLSKLPVISLDSSTCLEKREPPYPDADDAMKAQEDLNDRLAPDREKNILGKKLPLEPRMMTAFELKLWIKQLKTEVVSETADCDFDEANRLEELIYNLQRVLEKGQTIR